MSKIQEALHEWFENVKGEPVNNIESNDEESLDSSKINAYIFIDLDNSSNKEVDLFNGLSKYSRIQVNIYADESHKGRLNSNSKIKSNINKAANKPNIIISKQKNNASDFRIICDIATVLTNPDIKYVYLVSKDEGYDATLSYLQSVYGDRIRALEKFATLPECFRDYELMNSESKDELMERLVTPYFHSYRDNTMRKLLRLLEVG